MNTCELPSSTTVVIVGGGPVGLATAVELGTRNVECVVLEPRTEVSPLRPRAKTSSVRTMEHFRRWGIADTVRNRASLPVRWSQDAAVCATLLGPEITRFTDCFGLMPEPHPDFAESGQQVAQPVVEQVLREKLTELPSVTFAAGWSLRSLDEHSDAVVVDAVSADSTIHRITAQHVVGCDGPTSPTRNAIGARLTGSIDGKTNVTIVFRARGLAQRVPHQPAVHYWIFAPGIAGVLGRFDLEDTWWAGTSGASQAEPARLVQELLGEPTDIEVLCVDSWQARMQLATSFQTGRVHLAGDAAHLNPPWGGHGYNTGIGDAVNIGWKLAAVTQGWGGPDLLQSYESERRRVAQRTIEATTRNMRAMLGLRASATEQKADTHTALAVAVQHAMRTEFHSLGLVLGNDYSNSPIVFADDTAPQRADEDITTHVASTRAGRRLPHVWLPSGQSAYDLLGAGLTLLHRSSRFGAFVDHARERGIPIAEAELPPAAVYDDVEALLVRPDQYIAWRAQEGDNSDHHPKVVLDRVLGHRDS
ncbi:FAD-dependent monooxygenase [Lentzea alba]|uniref:FAD-dependent monooxygenase n=1 Tax=Lentzea alba TaxID=2714351 RepID=UPI0039BF13A1